MPAKIFSRAEGSLTVSFLRRRRQNRQPTASEQLAASVLVDGSVTRRPWASKWLTKTGQRALIGTELQSKVPSLAQTLERKREARASSARTEGVIPKSASASADAGLRVAVVATSKVPERGQDSVREPDLEQKPPRRSARATVPTSRNSEPSSAASKRKRCDDDDEDGQPKAKKTRSTVARKPVKAGAVSNVPADGDRSSVSHRAGTPTLPADASSSAAPVPAGFSTRACLECARKKCKCTREMPGCSVCRKRGDACVYPS